MDEFTSYIDVACKADPADRETFRRLVRDGRALLGMSLREAADEFRTAPGTVSRWENGHSAPAVVARQAIIRFFVARIQRISSHLAKTGSGRRKPLVAGPV